MSSETELLVDSTPVADLDAVQQKLLFFDELEDWYQDNHYIKSGYARVTGLFVGCAKSLLFVHNETGNIYSHLVPGLLLFGFVYPYTKSSLPIYESHLVW